MTFVSCDSDPGLQTDSLVVAGLALVVVNSRAFTMSREGVDRHLYTVHTFSE